MRLLRLARDLEIEVLLEIFIDEDPGPAVESGAEILGVNARNLATFETSVDRVIELASALPVDRVRVAESGIKDHGDIVRLTEAGYDAFLIGETLVRSEDPSCVVAELVGRESVADRVERMNREQLRPEMTQEYEAEAREPSLEGGSDSLEEDGLP
jgi:indole-3-glycerol phosphate synthase